MNILIGVPEEKIEKFSPYIEAFEKDYGFRIYTYLDIIKYIGVEYFEYNTKSFWPKTTEEASAFMSNMVRFIETLDSVALTSLITDKIKADFVESSETECFKCLIVGVDRVNIKKLFSPKDPSFFYMKKVSGKGAVLSNIFEKSILLCFDEQSDCDISFDYYINTKNNTIEEGLSMLSSFSGGDAK
jgi:hypothetical protein